MRLAIVGGRGMLGRDLADAARKKGIEPLILDLPEVDISRPVGLRDVLAPADVVVNCAAYTRVDEAERERDVCHAVNALGAGFVAHACAESHAYLIHISTDYVFSGEKNTPWTEEDPVAPLNYYGRTKLEGELRVLASCARALIVRTQSLYGIHGRSFPRAILNQLAAGKRELRVVSDQISSPTYTRHLADILLDLARLRPQERILHAAASGACSWWEFACAIVNRVRPGTPVIRISSSELNLPARRPTYSVLDTTKLQRLLGRCPPSWQEGLDAYLEEEELVTRLRAT